MGGGIKRIAYYADGWWYLYLFAVRLRASSWFDQSILGRRWCCHDCHRATAPLLDPLWSGRRATCRGLRERWIAVCVCNPYLLSTWRQAVVPCHSLYHTLRKRSYLSQVLRVWLLYLVERLYDSLELPGDLLPRCGDWGVASFVVLIVRACVVLLWERSVSVACAWQLFDA